MVGSVGEPSRSTKRTKRAAPVTDTTPVLKLEYFVNVMMCVVGHICHSHQRVQIPNVHCTIGVQDRENEHKFYNVRLVEFTCVWNATKNSTQLKKSMICGILLQQQLVNTKTLMNRVTTMLLQCR